MTSIAVVTPVAPNRSQWLVELAADVSGLRAAVGDRHVIQWVVCADSNEALSVDGADNVCTGLPGGPAVARTRALVAAKCDWVFPVDADDRLDLNGVVAVLDRLDGLPASVGWVGAGRVLVDGTPTPHTDVPERAWVAGELAEAWGAPFVFHPNSIIARRGDALLAGGWPATRVNEDLGFVLLLSEISAGVTVSDVITRYRVWEGQTVTTPEYPLAKQTAFETIAALVNARRSEQGRSAIEPPPSGGPFGVTSR